MNRVRKALERTYKGKCTVYEMQSVRDEVTKLEDDKEVAVLKDQPCKLSYSTMDSTSDKDGAVEKVISTKLFISPDIMINPGSKIVVTQDGITTAFSHSGEPGHFTNHQEIELKLFERWA